MALKSVRKCIIKALDCALLSLLKSGFLPAFRYNLLFYINPQFYGYAAITKILLLNVRLNCEYESTLNCISTDGNAVLARFGLETVNPYEHLVVSIPWRPDDMMETTESHNNGKSYKISLSEKTFFFAR